ncbi:hypothetical protein [Arthrobacter sp. 162MFSha1.1]|uniref:hypothetical protein n=1 Tax=Arthrobacter sp. 162MFSha1.1 TaxID=1151119 RepID=UPI000377B224|nr:hypothetical protein [Arthrobacter sp. 162MFSha1.1]
MLSPTHLLRITGGAIALSVLLTACGKADPPPKPSAAHTAGVALQEADDTVRADFKKVIAENASNAGGMPCDRECWDLTHLERDDVGTVGGAYRTAAGAYSDSPGGAPAELAKWKAAMETVRLDITAWGDTGAWSKGVQNHPAEIAARVSKDLDQADALVNAIAPPAVRASPRATH